MTTRVRPGPRKIRAPSGVRSRPSRTIRQCGVARFHPRRRVRRGSSAITVPAPTSTASCSSRRRERPVACRLARDPAALPGGRRDAAVESRSPLGEDQRPPRDDPRPEPGILQPPRARARPAGPGSPRLRRGGEPRSRAPRPAGSDPRPRPRPSAGPRRPRPGRREASGPDARRAPASGTGRLPGPASPPPGAPGSRHGAIPPAGDDPRRRPARFARRPRRPSGWARRSTGPARPARTPDPGRSDQLAASSPRSARAYSAGSNGTRSSNPSPTPTESTGSFSSR